MIKTRYTLTTILLGSAMLFSACQKEEIDSIPEGAIKLTTEGFSNGDGSKTSVSGYTVEWVNGDKVTINNEEYTVFVDGSTAYITPGEGSEPTAPSAPYYGYYSCGTVNEPSSTNPTVTVPASYSCSYDGSGRQVIALPMVSYQSSTASAIAFKHVTAAVKGCVFLPAAGYGSGVSHINDAGSWGSYWSSSSYTDHVEYASGVQFRENGTLGVIHWTRSTKQSVRLVKDAD